MQYKSIGLVDFSHMLVVNFKALGKSQGPNDAENQTMVQLAGIRSSCEHVVVCLDSKPYKRSEIYPEYKAQREREPELVAMWKRCVERLTLDGYQTAKAPGAEADDVIATLAVAYAGEEDERSGETSLGYGCNDVRIYGTDKDCLQCLNEYVRCFSYIGGGEWEIRDADWCRKKFGGIDWTKEKTPGPSPEHIPLVLAIMGDKSDNIPGIDGIGVKGAVKLVHSYRDPAGMAMACTAQVEAAKMTGKLPAFWRDYAAGMVKLPLWLKLTTLDKNVELDKHPLKYLEKLEMKPLVQSEPNDADDSGFGPDDFGGTDEPDWERIEKETAERERAELQRVADEVISKHPTVPRESAEAMVGLGARIGKDPKADEHLQREALVRENEKNVREARERHPPKRNASLPDGGAAAYAAEHDRHGVKRPEPTPLDPPPKGHTGSSPTGEGSRETTGSADPKAVAAAMQTNGSTANQSSTSIGSIGPSAAEVVSKTQGPQPERMSMVVVPPPSWELATQPRSPSEMLKVAADFFNSRLFQQYGNHNAVFTVIALGRELGLGMSQSLAGFFIVEQKPYMSAALCRALVQRHPDCDYFLCKHSDEKSATWVLRRKSWPQGYESTLTYTWDLATKAGLTTGKNRHNWEGKPVEMLTKTAASKLGKRDFADATFGLDTESEIV